MLRALVVASAWMFVGACNGSDKTPAGDDDDDDDSTTYTFDCAVTDPFDLPDPFAPIAGNEHACESQPAYIDTVPTSTSYFVGEFHFDDCGNMKGRETWLLHANPRWVELGGQDCQVAWDVDGSAVVTGGEITMSLSAVLDASDTTCDDIEDFMDFVDSTFNATYDVARSGSDATFFFAGGSEFATGQANDNHAVYTTAFQCDLF